MCILILDYCIIVCFDRIWNFKSAYGKENRKKWLMIFIQNFSYVVFLRRQFVGYLIKNYNRWFGIRNKIEKKTVAQNVSEQKFLKKYFDLSTNTRCFKKIPKMYHLHWFSQVQEKRKKYEYIFEWGKQIWPREKKYR